MARLRNIITSAAVSNPSGALLMAIYVFLMIFLVQLPRAATSGNDLLNIFRNTMVTGALLMYTHAFAGDKRYVD